MQLSENVLVEELDRLIHSAIMRIEQQRLHLAESSASRSQVADAKRVLKQMNDGLRQLKLRRAQIRLELACPALNKRKKISG
jgi:hypothetical protein